MLKMGKIDSRLYDLVFHYSIGFDFDQPIRINKTSHLHDGVGWPRTSEKLAMYQGDLFLVFNSRQQNRGANYI